MKIETTNGYIVYSVEDEEIVIDNVVAHSKRTGTGSALVKEVIKIAEEKELNIGLCAYPQDDSIELSDLVAFYEKLGFEIDYDDDTHVLMSYKI